MESLIDSFDRFKNLSLNDASYESDTGSTWTELTTTQLRTNSSGVCYGDESNRWNSAYAAVICDTPFVESNYWVEATVFVPNSDIGSSITLLLSIDSATTNNTPTKCISITWQPYDANNEINPSKHGWISEDYALNIGYSLTDEFRLIDGRGLHTYRVELHGRTITVLIDGITMWVGTMTPDATALPLTGRVGFGMKTVAGEFDKDYFSVLQVNAGTFKAPTQIVGTLPIENEYSILPEPSTYSNVNDMRAIRGGFDHTFVNKFAWFTEVDIGFPVNFMGTIYTKLKIYQNGYVSFDNKIDLAIFYTSQPCDLTLRGQGTIKYGPGVVYGRNAFGITWNNVGYQNTSSRIDKRNTFQMVFVQRTDIGDTSFDLEFNYGKVEWESCDADGGSLGVGGNNAWIGHRKDWVDPIVVSTFSIPPTLNFAGNSEPGYYLDSNRETSLLSNNLRSVINGRYTQYFYNGYENDWLINFFFKDPYGSTNYNYGSRLGFFYEKAFEEEFRFTYPTFNSRLLVATDIVEINRKTATYEPPHQMTVPTMLGEFGSDSITVDNNKVSIKMKSGKNNYSTLLSYVTRDYKEVTLSNSVDVPADTDMFYYRKQDELMFVDFKVDLVNDTFSTPIYFHIQILPEDYTIGKWFIKETIYNQYINIV